VKEPTDQGPRSKWVQLLLGLLFGIAFGFFLQKGGAAKYHILIGVLLLEDWTVIQIMLSAIVVGMVGLFPMAAMGWIKLNPKPSRFAANMIGGLLFGIGFAMSAYCPGTSAAALGQGNYDALAVILGMIAGSWVFAETSGWTARYVDPLGDRGKLTFTDLFGHHRGATVTALAIILAAAAAAFHWIPTL
jgi:hypothetical protein